MCLGEIALDLNPLDFNVMDITSSSDDSIDFSVDPLLQVQTSAIELLTKLIHSNDVDTAIVAKDTLKGVLFYSI